MKKSVVVLFFLLLSGPIFGAEMKTLDTFDFYAAPSFGVGSGSYEAGQVDEGSFSALNYGIRLGFKLGPVLLGGDLSLNTPWARSTKINLSSTDQIKYTMNSGKSAGALGVNLGFFTDRVVVWGNYYPFASLETEAYEGINKYENKYNGSSFSAEINFRIWDRLYLGFFGQQREFNQYSTTYSTAPVKDQDLRPSITARTYGLTLSYLFPVSELSKVGSWFPKP